MGMQHDRGALRGLPSPGVWLTAAAMLGLVGLGLPVRAQAGVAANQLCGMSGLGAGCIGTFRPRGMGVTGAARPNVGGMMGGLVGTIMGVVVDQMVDQMLQSATQQAAQESAPDFSGAVQSAVERQARFQQDRDRQLLAAMADVAASQLADSPSNMGLLEPLAYQASLGFDRPLGATGDALWMRVQDPWYSPESGGDPAPGARPLAIADRRLQYSVRDTDSLQCMQAMGGELCGFPGTKGPALTLEPVPIQPSPPPSPVIISSPTPGPVPVTGGTPQILRTDVPTAPVGSNWQPQEPADPEPPCSAAIALDAPETLMAVARSEDPQAAGGAYILNLTVSKLQGQLGKLGELQGKIATVMTGAYREFVRQLLCRNLALLAAAPRDITFGRGNAAAQADEIEAWAERGLLESGIEQYLSEVKGMLKEKVDELKDDLKAEARQSVEDALLNRPPPRLDRDIPPYSGAATASPRYREPWNVAARFRHWLEGSPHDHLLPGNEGPNAGAFKE